MAEIIATSTIPALLSSPTDETAPATTPASPEQAPPDEKLHTNHLPQRKNSHWLLCIVVIGAILVLIAAMPRIYHSTQAALNNRSARKQARRRQEELVSAAAAVGATAGDLATLQQYARNGGRGEGGDVELDRLDGRGRRVE